MKFENLNAELTIKDTLDLNTVKLVLTFEGDNPEIKEIIKQHFDNKTRLRSDSTSSEASTSVTLDDNGKKNIKTISAMLTKLDTAFGRRVGLVKEFEDLL